MISRCSCFKTKKISLKQNQTDLIHHVKSRDNPNHVHKKLHWGILNLYPGYTILSCSPHFLKYDWLKIEPQILCNFILENIFRFAKKIGTKENKIKARTHKIKKEKTFKNF